MGMKDPQYDPIRITVDETVNRHNEGIMTMDDNPVIMLLELSKGEIDPDAEEKKNDMKRHYPTVCIVRLAITHGPLGLIC